MTDSPIPFSPLMVRAILREIEQPGTGKTQTRRIIKSPVLPVDDVPSEVQEDLEMQGWEVFGNVMAKVTYAPGDRLWVKEAWRTGRAYDDLSPSEMSGEEPIQYEAGPIRLPLQDGRYRHARFMPRWASRITLLVTDVRVERLQNISEDDAEAEGWPAPQDRAKTGIAEIRDAYPIGWYAALWESLHGPGSWEANPFVAVYGFRPVLANIDAMEG